jgi:hypothetical protein
MKVPRTHGPAPHSGKAAGLFRGEPAHVWVRRLHAQGWPTEIAKKVALFLTVKGTPPPRFEELLNAAKQPLPRSAVL